MRARERRGTLTMARERKGTLMRTRERRGTLTRAREQIETGRLTFITNY